MYFKLKLCYTVSIIYFIICMNYYIEVLKKYAIFKGRATRSEFWYFTLVNTIIFVVLALIDQRLFDASFLEDRGPLSTAYFLITLIPTLAVSARRLHDINYSGWLLLINAIPIGSLVLLVFFTRDSNKDQNQYGPNPKLAPIN